MTQSNCSHTGGGSDAVEALLRHAAPRPAPPQRDAQLVRDTVHAEWRTLTGGLRRRRRYRNLALAASVIVAVAIAFSALRLDTALPVQVATIDKGHGPIYVLGEGSELLALPDAAIVSAGQTIVTGPGAGLGLAWGSGGSLRVDEQTRVEFNSPESVYLHSGRLYFDSEASGLVAGTSAGSVAGPASLFIETPHGVVRHLGTQYMTFADGQRLAVSVREGRVEVDGLRYRETASAGQQLTLTGTGRPSVVDFSGYGGAWDWTEAVAPAAELDGRTVHEFLDWVSRETGLAVEYESPAAEDLARSETLRGTVDSRPTNALRVWMLAVDLDWRVEGGVIRITATNSEGGG